LIDGEKGVEIALQIRESRNSYELLSLGLRFALQDLNCALGLEGTIDLMKDDEGEVILNRDDDEVEKAAKRLLSTL
jgi:hypothetical protein